MKNTKLLVSLALVLLLTGCATLFSSTVTITKVVDVTMKAWADASANGKTSPAVDANVIAAHNTYRKACSAAKNALIAYKASGDPLEYQNALQAAKDAAQGVLDLVTPLLLPSQATSLNTQLGKASTI